MNKYEFDVLKAIYKEGYTNQGKLAAFTNFSLGKVNSTIRRLIENDYLNAGFELTDKTLQLFNLRKPCNAIILAAGFGLRMVPIHTEDPKGLLKVHGETLIERLIAQLHEAGIVDIDIVVGFMKEKYEFLIDQYNVNLIYNPHYATKNNIHSLNLLVDKINNTYIIPCDVWSQHNPFTYNELYSWYAISEVVDDESTVKLNREMKLVNVEKNKAGNQMIGISYLCEEQSPVLREKIKSFCKNKKYDHSFWEEALFDNDRIEVYGKCFKADEVTEINTYEQLREMDEDSEHLNCDIISMIANQMKVKSSDIKDIILLKKGMTNRSFRFSCNGYHYIMRVPGEGTDHMINRKYEADVYQILKSKGISDEVLYISSQSGYKITEYWENARVCNGDDLDDIKLCMNHLKKFHERKLKVSHSFNIFEQLEFYESLWPVKESIFADYHETKEKVLSLKTMIDTFDKEWVLTHVDINPDNFLILDHNDVRIIDWEYAGMQDPHLDIAMFAIYCMYDRNRVDQLIDIYFDNNCSNMVKKKIYAYIAVCGLLWSNWCEYKRQCGVEFGEYSLRQYQYAKEYYKIVKNYNN
jgi:CTP:phosphocholine cytidylyltransferase-like protein/thiamine kinase-like enzyme